MVGIARSNVRVAAAALIGSVVLLSASAPAVAQSGCDQLATYLQQRKAIADGLGGSGKKKQIDAKVACSGFGSLVNNGATLIKWSEANKEWCRIPDSFIEGVKADNEKAAAIRAKACNVASQMQKMEKQAREGAGGGLLGGGGLTGAQRLPQGAL